MSSMDDGTTPVEAGIGGGATGGLLQRISLGILARISEEVVAADSGRCKISGCEGDTSFPLVELAAFSSAEEEVTVTSGGADTSISGRVVACVLDGVGGGLLSVLFITVPAAAAEGAVPLAVAA